MKWKLRKFYLPGHIFRQMKNDSPSSTANIVARNIAIVAATEETSLVVSPETARLNSLLIKTFSPSGERFIKRASHRWFQKLFHVFSLLTIRGLALHQALRKLHIENAVRQSLTENFRQVVILGGGLDTLSLRLCRAFPLVNFIEIDHPATQKVKLKAIKDQKLETENLHFLAADFTKQDLAEILNLSSNYDPQSRTVFICEGVLMYLKTEEVGEIFDFIKHQKADATRFIFTFMKPDKNGKINFRRSTFLVRLWLRWKNEPFKWGMKNKNLERFLAHKGFLIRELTTAETFRQKYLKKFGLENHSFAEGENICICETKSK